MDAEFFHIVMFPWLAFGHLLPFFELAKCLAEKGNRISFISTPRNIKRLPKLPPHLTHLLNFVEFSLPQIQNLPIDAEATSDLPLDKVPYLKKAFDGLESSLASFLESSYPDWIIYDFIPYWLPPITAKLNIPCAFFSIFNAANLCYFGPPSALLDVTDDSRTDPEDYSVSAKWIPFDNNLAFRKFELSRWFNDVIVENASGVGDAFRFGSAVQECDIVAVRSSTEFEPEWLKLLQDELYKKPVLPLGLLPPQLDNVEDEDENWLTIKGWLDKQDHGSVVYVALGSEATLNEQETTELALGLELSKLPFLWVLRKPAGSIEFVLPTGFEDRVKGRGIIWRAWVPQLRVLSHPSMGGSLMHSGYSSVVETLGFGYPLVLLPMVNDQAILARLLEWKKIGVEIPRKDEDGSFTKESVAGLLRKVMVDYEGEHYRAIARDLRQVFGNKILNDTYIDSFANYLKNNRRSKSS
ncbi:Udp-glycosyltransferase [Thalictrum thalictroides]|uniref:Udp-glycosyltransferase n=1 Tax=Thalictrum thalictroides TaxID=46969 RepID=A0A7J6VKT4_THATH|nr:Udp-glycosyltransferase [Thalictrum thalictroides]